MIVEIKIKVTKANLLKIIVNHGLLTGTHSKRELSAQTLIARNAVVKLRSIAFRASIVTS